MPCLLVIVILAFPRVVLALMFLLTTYLERAYHSVLIPLLGFIFLPVTTIVYAWLVNNHYPMDGLNLVWVVLAVLIDLGSVGHGYTRRRYR